MRTTKKLTRNRSENLREARVGAHESLSWGWSQSPAGMFFGQYSMPGPAMMNMGMGMNPMMAPGPGAFNQHHQYHYQQFSNGGGVMMGPGGGGAAGKGGMPQQQPPFVQAPPPRSAGIPLALSCDDEQLSEYQMLVRKQLEGECEMLFLFIFDDNTQYISCGTIPYITLNC